MIDIFMTPQSEDESFEDNMSPEEAQLSPVKIDETKDKEKDSSSPPVSTFLADDDLVEAEDNEEISVHNEPSTDTEAAKMSASDDSQTNDNRNEVEEEAKGDSKDDADGSSTTLADDAQTSGASADLAEDGDIAIYSDT